MRWPSFANWRYELCAVGGIVATLCFAAPIEEIGRQISSDGNRSPGAIAGRVYYHSQDYALPIETPVLDSLAFNPLGGRVSGPCEARLNQRLGVPQHDIDDFVLTAFDKWEVDAIRSAYERPAVDALMRLPPWLLQALDGCMRASLLKPICGRYVMTVAARVRTGRENGIIREQDAIANTTEAAFCRQVAGKPAK